MTVDRCCQTSQQSKDKSQLCLNGHSRQPTQRGTTLTSLDSLPREQWPLPLSKPPDKGVVQQPNHNLTKQAAPGKHHVEEWRKGRTRWSGDQRMGRGDQSSRLSKDRKSRPIAARASRSSFFTSNGCRPRHHQHCHQRDPPPPPSHSCQTTTSSSSTPPHHGDDTSRSKIIQVAQQRKPDNAKPEAKGTQTHSSCYQQ